MGIFSTEIAKKQIGMDSPRVWDSLTCDGGLFGLNWLYLIILPQKLGMEQ